MDKYAPYVIASYIISAAGLVWIVAAAVWRARSAARRLARAEAEDVAGDASRSDVKP